MKSQMAYDEMEGKLRVSALALKAEIRERKKERRRFGAQLHDGICQELTGILMFAKSLAQKMEKNNSPELAEFNRMSTMLRIAADQARELARGLDG